MTQPNAETDSGNVPSMPSVALFRTLDPTEVQAFRAWARANYTPLSDIKGIWHPIIQDECRQINQEHGRSVRLSPFYAHSAMRNTEPLRRDPEQACDITGTWDGCQVGSDADSGL